MNLETQKELLTQNYRAVDMLKDGITKKLLKSEPYIVGDYFSKMGFKFIKESNQKQYITKVNLIGIYHVQIKFRDQYIDLYTGESEACIGTRIARLIKQASGENRDDETHSAGELLYNKFSKYGRKDLWLNNLRVRFLQIKDINDMLGLTSFPYHNLFDTLRGMKDVNVIMAPPLSMGVFSYPHREGARLTLETLLGIMDGEDDPGIKEYNIVVKERNFINNMRTVYRESEDQLPGIDTTME